MNQRRVAALEKIGESCRIASSNKKNVDPSVVPIEPKKEVNVPNPPAVKDLPDDEIKMWGKIVDRKHQGNRESHPERRSHGPHSHDSPSC